MQGGGGKKQINPNRNAKHQVALNTDPNDSDGSSFSESIIYTGNYTSSILQRQRTKKRKQGSDGLHTLIAKRTSGSARSQNTSRSQAPSQTLPNSSGDLVSALSVSFQIPTSSKVSQTNISTAAGIDLHKAPIILDPKKGSNMKTQEPKTPLNPDKSLITCSNR